MMPREELDSLSRHILGACLTVHKEMGPGLLESIYELCLLEELSRRGIRADNQVSIPLTYRGKRLPKDFRIDVLVEQEIIVEVKFAERTLPVHKAQIISHLKLADRRLGFLVNFNVSLLKDGFHRFVNGF